MLTDSDDMNALSIGELCDAESVSGSVRVAVGQQQDDVLHTFAVAATSGEAARAHQTVDGLISSCKINHAHISVMNPKASVAKNGIQTCCWGGGDSDVIIIELRGKYRMYVLCVRIVDIKFTSGILYKRSMHVCFMQEF